MTVREDAQGAMWIGADAGLYRIAPGATNAIRIAGDHGTMIAIFPDSHGDLWFGTRNGSVGRWRDGAFAWVGTARGSAFARSPRPATVCGSAPTMDCSG